MLKRRRELLYYRGREEASVTVAVCYVARQFLSLSTNLFVQYAIQRVAQGRLTHHGHEPLHQVVVAVVGEHGHFVDQVRGSRINQAGQGRALHRAGSASKRKRRR